MVKYKAYKIEVNFRVIMHILIHHKSLEVSVQKEEGVPALENDSRTQDIVSQSYYKAPRDSLLLS